MSANKTETATDGRDLSLTRVINAPPAMLYNAWTEPHLLKQWFAPKPWTTTKVENDVRPGGASLLIMRSPDGQEFSNRGVYLEVIPNQRIVFTDAYTSAWELSENPFMTGILTFEAHAQGTRYTARVRHWTIAAREAHEKMGFHQGWPVCTEQLASLVESKT
jgi:uncharacterized protein YndB with AHSA1/START domain